MVSTDLSNLVPLALVLINPVETFTLVYNLYTIKNVSNLDTTDIICYYKYKYMDIVRK